MDMNVTPTVKTTISAVGRSVQTILERLRRSLLDVGRRNRLINSPRHGKRAAILNIIEAEADTIFETLVRYARAMNFLPLLDDQDDRKQKPANSQLQTELPPEKLQKKLLSFYRDARTLEEEQGVNILFLAIGFLRWYESPSSDEINEAPLILVPVSLIRDSVRSSFKLSMRDDDIEINLSLQEKLKQEFGIDLPEIPESDEWKPSEYFEKVTNIIISQRRWSVDGKAISLGFFSFSKFLMFKDLDPSNWPNLNLLDHPLIKNLLVDGFSKSSPLFSENDSLDKFLDPANLVHVVDADSSQALVIETVRAGQNLVVQGPPGTGKSQTITNIIASAVRDGKSVLFVAEKMAALTVVHHRLEKVGLKSVCLELHSRKANKKALIEEIRKTFENRKQSHTSKAQTEELRKLRDRLNIEAGLLHRPIESSGTTPFRMLGEQVRILESGYKPKKINIPDCADWDEEKLRSIEISLARFEKIISEAGSPINHPWRGAKRVIASYSDREELSAGCTALAVELTKVFQCVHEVARATGSNSDPKIIEITQIIRALRLLAQRPQATKELWVALARLEKLDTAQDLILLGCRWQEINAWCIETFHHHAWNAEIESLYASISSAQDSFFKRLMPSYRKASRQLSILLRLPLPKKHQDRALALKNLIEAAKLKTRIANHDSDGLTVFATEWQCERTDFYRLEKIIDWVGKIKSLPLNLDDRFISCGITNPQFSSLADELDAHWRKSFENLKFVVKMLNFDFLVGFGAENISDITLKSLQERAKNWLAYIDRLDEWLRLAASKEQLETLGVGVLTDALADGSVPVGHASDELRYSRSEMLWKRAVEKEPRLLLLDGDERTLAVKRFQELDRERQTLTVREVLAQYSGGLSEITTAGSNLLKGEIARKRGHSAIRKLIGRAGHDFQKLKPVFLMSPLSVAQFLAPSAITFDLLVIDEASQIKPEDALGSIARSKQVVIVGDRQQLPPTSFFDRVLGGDEEEIEEPIEGPQVGEFESVLTLCEARGMSDKMLKWHYRSKHQSLIQVSNFEFYNSELFIPPSVWRDSSTSGLIVRRVNGAYDRGNTRTNRLEAEALVEAVARHAKTDPQMSLGIATFSVVQRELIENLLDAKRREDITLDVFMREAKDEATFVKNLENVQGDERDVIFISIGYGPTIAGSGLDSMSFGPVSVEGGERRLNVLFTRARYRCEVFVSFDSGDIDLKRTTQRGPAVLKRFLNFAEGGKLDLPKAGTGEHDSPFEEAIAKVIKDFGYDFDAQVGAAQFRIDLAVIDPRQPGKYIIGIECDGATYHSARWARDRDRLREQVLRELGWNIHRIWSTDWFRRPDIEKKKLRLAIQEAIEFSEKKRNAIALN